MIALFVAVLGAFLAGFAIWGKRKRQRLLSTIEVITLSEVAATQLGNQREIKIYLPPRYRTREDERFDVLYINDGQECEALGLRDTLARLTAAGRIRPLIAVAVPTNDNRLHEYGTAIAMNKLGLGLLAPAYTHFFVEELMPLIERTFRTRPGAGLLGVSLGGLSAFDIAWNNPERFAAVGILSGSFWWRAGDEEVRIDAGRRIAHSLARRATARPPFRLFFQAGTRDEVNDRDGNGVIDAIQDTLELIAELQAIGCGPEQVTYVEVPGGRHDFETWARVLPVFLEWAFSPAGPGRQT
jgi:enterochelin esterase-like enzyme